MKKLLSLLAAVGLTATSTTTVIACDTGDTDGNPNAGETFAIGEISNIYSETILKAAESKISNFKASDYEVYSYDQTSAKLIQKKSVSSSATFNPVTVTYTIKALDFREDNNNLKLNILVGNMDKYGVIDQTTKIADIMSKQLITEDSIRTSFAQMNGTFLNESDIEIGEVDYAAKTVEITSKNQNILKGDKITVILNQGISSQDLLRDLNIGNIYLPKTFYDKKEELFDGTNSEAGSNVSTSFPLLFQNLGDRNKLFSYLASDLVLSSMSMLAVAKETIEENISLTSAKISLAWDDPVTASFMPNTLVKEGIISPEESQAVSMNYNILNDERVVVGEFLPENGIVVKQQTYNSKNPTNVAKEIYKQFGDDFKSKISEEIFVKYSAIHFNGEDNEPTIEFLPGGDYIYALNSQAFGLISGQLTDEEKELLTPPTNSAKIPGYTFIVE